MNLTEKQQAVLTVIESHIEEKGFSPTVREVSVRMGWSSPSTTHNCLNVLKRKGFLTWHPRQPRTFQILKR
ncbi:LexA family protein [Paenibacillus senegalensis]|uniref:LexA family protein n=1 Tax=Paenibacillus senegalensis TaxID=1465766 RepID=UPI0002892BBF|nr:heme-binding protein [Paenibacillus senegalensis]